MEEEEEQVRCKESILIEVFLLKLPMKTLSSLIMFPYHVMVPFF